MQIPIVQSNFDLIGKSVLSLLDIVLYGIENCVL